MLNKIKDCFDKHPVNLGRQRELDIAKGIAIIFMSFSHCIEILGWFFDPNISPNPSWHDFDMVIKGLALIFIICMGISLCYSTKSSVDALVHRAFNMAGIVVLLEISRTVIPTFFEWLIFCDFESIRYSGQIFSVDILQFATIALLMIALFKKLNIKPMLMIVISIVLSIVGQLLQGASTGSRLGDILVGYFWHSHDAAYFPMFNWLIAIVIGYALGHFWLRLKDKESFFKLITPICWIISILYFVSMVIVGEWYYFSGGCYCGIGVLDIFFMSVIFLAVAGTSHFLGKWIPKISNWLESMGVRINSIYCIHWVIYAALYLTLKCVVGNDFIPMWAVVPVAILVLIVADALSRFYKRLQQDISLGFRRKNT